MFCFVVSAQYLVPLPLWEHATPLSLEFSIDFVYSSTKRSSQINFVNKESRLGTSLKRAPSQLSQTLPSKSTKSTKTSVGGNTPEYVNSPSLSKSCYPFIVATNVGDIILTEGPPQYIFDSGDILIRHATGRNARFPNCQLQPPFLGCGHLEEPKVPSERSCHHRLY